MRYFAPAGRWLADVTRRIRGVPSALTAIAMDWRLFLTLIATSRTVHIGLASIGLFWLAAIFSDFYNLFMVVNFSVIAIEIVVLFAYFPAFILSLTVWPPSNRAQLVMGIWIAWGFDFTQRIWSIVWRVGGKPEWMITSDVLTFMLFGRMIGVMLHLTATTIGQAEVPRADWVKLGIAFTLGGLTALVLILFGLRDIIEPI